MVERVRKATTWRIRRILLVFKTSSAGSRELEVSAMQCCHRPTQNRRFPPQSQSVFQPEHHLSVSLQHWQIVLSIPRFPIGRPTATPQHTHAPHRRVATGTAAPQVGPTPDPAPNPGHHLIHKLFADPRVTLQKPIMLPFSSHFTIQFSLAGSGHSQPCLGFGLHSTFRC